MELESKKYTLEQLAQQFGAQYSGNPSTQVDGVATLQNASSGKISFFANKKYKHLLKTTKASVVILAAEDSEYCDRSKLLTNNPYLIFAKIATLYKTNEVLYKGTHPNATVQPTASLDKTACVGSSVYIGHDVVIKENAVIEANAVIKDHAVIGCNTRIGSNVVINHHVQIGDRVIVHPGAIIGADGFGLAKEGKSWFKVPQLGSVIIGDDCEIGANTTIDRGAIENTILENDVRLDNQIQIGHNVYIGAHTAIAGCAGISGSVKIGRNCLIGGGVGIVGHVEIADSTIIAGGCVVTKSISEPGYYASGMPFDKYQVWRKNAVRIRQLDSIAKRLKRLETLING